MARYSCVTQLSGSAEQLQESIRQLLERCSLNILHNSRDYWVAGEAPGQKPFNQLVTVEVLMNWKYRDQSYAEVTCIAKNEELPLKSTNHCQQTFQQLESEFHQLQTQLQLATATGDPLS